MLTEQTRLRDFPSLANRAYLNTAAEGILPDVLCFNPSKPAKYPNGRVFTDDVIDTRVALLTKGECPPTGLKPHTDVLTEFPYLGNPHQPTS